MIIEMREKKQIQELANQWDKGIMDWDLHLALAEFLPETEETFFSCGKAKNQAFPLRQAWSCLGVGSIIVDFLKGGNNPCALKKAEKVLLTYGRHVGVWMYVADTEPGGCI